MEYLNCYACNNECSHAYYMKDIYCVPCRAIVSLCDVVSKYAFQEFEADVVQCVTNIALMLTPCALHEARCFALKRHLYSLLKLHMRLNM